MKKKETSSTNLLNIFGTILNPPKQIKKKTKTNHQPSWFYRNE